MSSSIKSSSEKNILRAIKDTLELLEWPRLCEHLSTFASTTQGRSECRLLPLANDLMTSRLRLDETKEIGLLDSLIEGGLSFTGVHDLYPILTLCRKGGVASGEDLLAVADTLSAARRLRRQLDDRDLRPALTAVLAGVATLPDLEKCLKLGLDEGGRVADRASPLLAELRSKSKVLKFQRRDRFQELFVTYSSILQDTVIAERNNRPVLAVKSGAVGQLPGLVHDSSASGNTIFVEPQQVISLGNRLVELAARIAEQEQLLLAKWSQLVADNFDSLQDLAAALLKIDVALARARYGNWIGGVPPILEEDANAPFVLKEFRHPLLVWQERYEQGEQVVPISVEVPSDIRVVAITGPNTGGKTVALKSIGLATLMASSGLFLPCSGCPSLPWCGQVLADIGDEQSLQQNLSTFSGHIKRIGRIFDALSDSSEPVLVLLDEVGAGTDPAEGTALAISILGTMAERARLTIATTHFGELKALKYSDARFENASVEFDSETMSPAYKLQWGIPGKSNALAIAERLGLDSQVIQDANNLLFSGSKKDMNAVIFGLEEQRKRQQLAAEEAAVLLARTELLHEELLARWQQQLKFSAELKEHGRQQINREIRVAQEEVRALIQKLREQGADGETARSAGVKLRRIEVENNFLPEQPITKGWSPQVGERIRVIPLAKSGEVLSISEDGLYLTVQCGMLRSKVHISSIESLDGRKTEPVKSIVEVKTSRNFGTSEKVRMKSNTIDVRGMRVHEAEIVVEEFLRKANGPIWVIHGIGTGKLKSGLRKWLENVSYVERVLDANKTDGGAGCSVIWLR